MVFKDKELSIVTYHKYLITGGHNQVVIINISIIKAISHFCEWLSLRDENLVIHNN